MAKLSEQIKKANVSNILKKVKSNKVVSKQELEAIEEFEQQQEESNKITSDSIILTAAQIAKLFRVTTMTIGNWQKLGLPKIAKNTYDLYKCFYWWEENINQGSSKKEDDARERYWFARAEAEEIKIARIKGELIKLDDVSGEFSQRAADLKTSLRALKYRISGILAGKNQEEIMEILETEIDEMLRNFCREGKYIIQEIKMQNKGISVENNGIFENDETPKKKNDLPKSKQRMIKKLLKKATEAKKMAKTTERKAKK